VTPGPGTAQSTGLSNGADLLKSALTNGNGHANGDAYFGGHSVYTTHDYENASHVGAFQAKPGYKQWVAQAGTLVANLLTCAGADHGMLYPRIGFTRVLGVVLLIVLALTCRGTWEIIISHKLRHVTNTRHPVTVITMDLHDPQGMCNGS